jgi:hypothetical protein
MKNLMCYLSLVLTIALCACNKVVELDGIDKLKFKQDTFGCNGYRANVKETLEKQLPELKQLSEGEIIDNLGMPDHKDLANRSQKYFKYYILGAPKCANGGFSQVLLVRFNSLNRVSEANITVEQ